jgi:hypothetical protein
MSVSERKRQVRADRLGVVVDDGNGIDRLTDGYLIRKTSFGWVDWQNGLLGVEVKPLCSGSVSIAIEYLEP